jgi:hypothetical protein
MFCCSSSRCARTLEAVQRGNASKVEHFDGCRKCLAAAMMAASSHDPACLAALLAAGLPVTQADKNGRTLLHAASASGSLACASLLLDTAGLARRSELLDARNAEGKVAADLVPATPPHHQSPLAMLLASQLGSGDIDALELWKSPRGAELFLLQEDGGVVPVAAGEVKAVQIGTGVAKMVVLLWEEAGGKCVVLCKASACLARGRGEYVFQNAATGLVYGIRMSKKAPAAEADAMRRLLMENTMFESEKQRNVVARGITGAASAIGGGIAWAAGLLGQAVARPQSEAEADTKAQRRLKEAELVSRDIRKKSGKVCAVADTAAESLFRKVLAFQSPPVVSPARLASATPAAPAAATLASATPAPSLVLAVSRGAGEVGEVFTALGDAGSLLFTAASDGTSHVVGSRYGSSAAGVVDNLSHTAKSIATTAMRLKAPKLTLVTAAASAMTAAATSEDSSSSTGSGSGSTDSSSS